MSSNTETQAESACLQVMLSGKQKQLPGQLQTLSTSLFKGRTQSSDNFCRCWVNPFLNWMLDKTLFKSDAVFLAWQFRTLSANSDRGAQDYEPKPG